MHNQPMRTHELACVKHATTCNHTNATNATLTNNGGTWRDNNNNNDTTNARGTI